MTDLRDYVTPAEAAALLGLSADTIKRRIRTGLLPAVRVSPRKTLINRADVEAQITPV